MENVNSKLILSLVKFRLNKIGNNNANPEEIFRFATIIQDELLLDTKCKQIEVTLNLENGKTGYLLDQPLHHIFSIIPSWPISYGVPEFIDPGQWNDYKEETGERPSFYTIFANKIWLAPPTVQTGDKLTFWGYQTNSTTEIDIDHGPEVGREVIPALVAGILSMFNPDFTNEFLRLKNSLLGYTNVSNNDGLIPNQKRNLWGN